MIEERQHYAGLLAEFEHGVTYATQVEQVISHRRATNESLDIRFYTRNKCHIPKKSRNIMFIL